MKVFVTGNRGLIGREATKYLRAHGHEVVGFDIRDGYDVQNLNAVRQRIHGCDAVLHLAAMQYRLQHEKVAMFRTNVLGTWNVLVAAEEAGIQRFVFASSVNALGIFHGEDEPDFLPIDATHPARPVQPYGQSKLLSERLCEAFSNRFGLTTICLRFAAVWRHDGFDRSLNKWQRDPESEWSPNWEYGAFVHVADAAVVCYQALHRPIEGHHILLVASDTATASGLSSKELAARLLPDVTFRENAGGTKSLVDTGPARDLLDWRPARTWAGFLEQHERARLRLPPGLRAIRLRILNRVRLTRNRLTKRSHGS